MDFQSKNTQTKAYMINQISTATNLSQKEVKEVLSAYQRFLLTILKADEEVKLLDLGKIKLSFTSERTAFNPKTKQKVVVPAKHSVKFTFSRKVKEFANSNEEWPSFDF